MSMSLVDAARREPPSGRKHKWVAKKDFKPGGQHGKLHRELGIPEDRKMPAARLEAATRSHDPEIRRDAVRAETMKSWRHGGSKADRRYGRSK